VIINTKNIMGGVKDQKTTYEEFKKATEPLHEEFDTEIPEAVEPEIRFCKYCGKEIS
jgi:hypothetical protein